MSLEKFPLQLRASSASSILSGKWTNELTENQLDRIKELESERDTGLNRNGNKVSFTDKKKEELAELLERLNSKRDMNALPTGAKSYIESIVEKYVYSYEDWVNTFELEKGTRGEDEGIDLYNTMFFTNYVKSTSKLSKGIWVGHPDVEDEQNKILLDCKLPYSKKQMPKTEQQMRDYVVSGGYDWQVKVYLYMKGWRKGIVFCALVDTPEDLIRLGQDLSLHEMHDVPMELRVRRHEVELTDEDIKRIKERAVASQEYATYYYNQIKF